MFEASIYAARRAQLAKNIGKGLVVLPANNLQPFNYTANTFPFRQDSTFLYYAGLDLPGMVLVMDLDAGTETLFGHDPTIDDVIWEGPLPSLPELAASAGIAHAEEAHRIGAYLGQQAAKGQTIHCLKPYHADLELLLRQWLGTDQIVSSEVLIKAIVAQRSYKTDMEIAQIEQALTTTQEIYRFAMAQTRPGKKEYEIVGGVLGIAGAGNGQMAYGPIFSVNGHVLHNHHYGNTMQAGQWVVADLGAENHMHYASDLTRTWPISGKFSPVQRDIYQTVLQAYTNAAQASKPGTTFRECHLLAWETIAAGLKNMGILQGDPAEMAQLGVPGLFMPHGLGHMLGLDVHDMENLGENYVGYAPGQERSTLMGLKSLRLARALETGFVLTIEPGIYFIPPLIDRWEAEGKFKDFIRYDQLRRFRNEGGCRIEDNFLITEHGARKLGPEVPREIGDVEAAVGVG
jgi:Xaa-Pro aminopeptidase